MEMVTAVLLMMSLTLFLFVILVVLAAGRVAMKAVGEIMALMSVGVIVGGFFNYGLNKDIEGFLLFLIFGMLFLFVGGTLKISGEIASERAIIRNVNRRTIMEKSKSGVVEEG